MQFLGYNLILYFSFLNKSMYLVIYVFSSDLKFESRKIKSRSKI
jgi:hypothetical protein